MSIQALPKGFKQYKDGIHDTIVRSSDGAGLKDLHDAGECPKDCTICASSTVQKEGNMSSLTQAFLVAALTEEVNLNEVIKATNNSLFRDVQRFADWVKKEPAESRRDLTQRFNRWMDELSNEDAFGTEGQNDPRGDQRNEEFVSEAFTRQHYEAIAKILRDYGTGDDSLHPEEFVDKIANKLADFFKQDNPRFDKGFFLSKCGL